MSMFNPAQLQSQMNSPYFAQMMQQAQGSGALQPAGPTQMPNMAPQLPMAQGNQSGISGGGGMSGQAPAAQPGFFQQMMSSPQGLTQGMSGLSSLYGMGSEAASGLGSLFGTSAGSALAGGVGPTMGSGIMGMATGGSSGLQWLDALLA